MLRFLTLMCLCLGTAFAQQSPDESRLLADFQKTLRTAKGKPLPIERAKELLSTLGGLDSQKLAEALVDAWLLLDDEASAVEQTRQAGNAEMAEILKGQEALEKRVLPIDKLARYNRLKTEVQEQRDAIESLRELQTAVAERLEHVHRKDALLFFVQKVAGSGKYPLPLKLAALRAVGAGAESVMPELAAALARAKDPGDLIPLIDAMALAGTAAQLHAAPVIALMQHKEEAVRERAAQALAKIAVPDAIEPMIALLTKSTGPTRQRVAAALEVLRGQQFGTNTGSWRAWWEAQGKALASGADLGKGKPSDRSEANRSYYFGIPQDHSNAVMYVIDCSGSMSKEIELDLGGTFDGKGGGGGGAGKAAAKTTRLEGCKKELIHALGLLRSEQQFDILWYNDLPHMWEPKMQPATKEAVARAQAFVATLQPASSTNIYDSLHTAFGMVGRGARDKYYGVELDTIFLLTDGSPTLPDGSLDSTEKVIVAVREWNPLHRVTIHTISIGRDLNTSFLRQLADENGGEYKQF